MKKNRTTSLLAAVIFSLMALVPTQSFTASANETIMENQNQVVSSIPESGYKTVYSYMDILGIYYEDIIDYCLEKNVEISKDITLQAFHDIFYAQDRYLISEYIEYLKKIIDTKAQYGIIFSVSDLTIKVDGMSSQIRSGGEGETKDWWEDINITQDLPQKPNYNNWLYRLRIGDIIYEEGEDIDINIEGTDINIEDVAETGHTAIVEANPTGTCDDNDGDGVDEEFQYWRVVEATKNSGVTYSVIDNDRFVKNKSIVLRVNCATEDECEFAASYCASQVGKGYADWKIVFGKFPYETNLWTCSSLIWYAYNLKNIDLCSHTLNAWPIDIYTSTKTTVMNYIEYEHLTFDIVGKHPFLFFYNSWDVDIYNTSSLNFNVYYNQKMCYDTHALKFDQSNLNDILSFYITQNSKKASPVLIEHNGTATHITACYILNIDGTEYKIVTAADQLDYTNGEGYCNMHYNIIMSKVAN